MSRLFVKGRLSEGERASLESAQAHYLRHVLRLGAGDRVLLVDEEGSEFEARLAGGQGSALVADVLQKLAPRPQPTLFVHLYAGLMKGKKMERLVRDHWTCCGRRLPLVSRRAPPPSLGTTPRSSLP